MAYPNKPINPVPQDGIKEVHVWRDWFTRLRNFCNNLNPGYYGSFYSSITQTVTGASTATKALFEHTYLSNGISVGTTTSQILVPTAGKYSFIVQTEFSKPNAAADQVFYWAQVNGVDIVNSTSDITLTGNNVSSGITANYILTMQAGDYFEFLYSCTDAAMTSKATAAGTGPTRPATPSFHLTVTQIEGPAVATA